MPQIAYPKRQPVKEYFLEKWKIEINIRKNNTIYILRETKTKENIIRSYLKINDLQNNFINEITEIVKKDNERFNFSVNNLIDFIFIFFFIGNDFLPCQRFIDIYGTGINGLINNYIKCIIKYDGIIKIRNNEIYFDILALSKPFLLASETLSHTRIKL